MRVTVTIPILNGSEYLKGCFSNLDNQIYRDFEVIFVIDHTTTPDVVESIASYCKRMENARYIIQDDDDGLAGARNIGIDEAKGDIIWFLDVDDYVYPTFLEEMVGIMDDNDAEIVFCNHFEYCRKKIPEIPVAREKIHSLTVSRMVTGNRMILKIDKDNLYFKIRSILFKFFENIKQYPNFNYNIDSLPDLNKCSDFSMLNDSLEKVSKFLPETIKNQWKNTIGKISIIGKINFEDFNVKTATFLINIYYDLDNSKEYTKDELEPIWERCNFQLEDYTNEEYSFEVTLDNLLKSGFLKTNDENYTVNV